MMRWMDRSIRNPGRRLLASPLILLLVAGLTGCSDNPLSSMKIFPVKGKGLLADGKPSAAGRVVFVTSEKALEFDGPVGADGSYTVKSAVGDGAPAGSYRIRVDIDPSSTSKGAGTARRRPGSGPAPFPAKYLDETTSGL